MMMLHDAGHSTPRLRSPLCGDNLGLMCRSVFVSGSEFLNGRRRDLYVGVACGWDLEPPQVGAYAGRYAHARGRVNPKP